MIDAIQVALAPFISISCFSHQYKKSYCGMINGAKAPDLPNYPFNGQLKLTAINIPSFACQPLIRINHNFDTIKQTNHTGIP
jgi:hypothetical protein